MALQYMDKQRVIGYIMDAWQKHLNTNQDPASRRWFSNGPGNNGGLYGKLEDVLFTDLVYRETEKQFMQHQDEAYTGIHDNRDGLSPESEAKCHFEYGKSQSISHTESNLIKTNMSLSIKGAIVKLTIGAEYAHEWKDENIINVTETCAYDYTVPVKVPAGKVYKLVVLHNRQEATTPYEAIVQIKGTSSASFNNPVNGQNIFTASAGELCEWINQFNSAGDESKNFSRDPQKPDQGILILHGKITADVSNNFSQVVYDITDSFEGENKATAPVVEMEPTG